MRRTAAFASLSATALTGVVLVSTTGTTAAATHPTSHHASARAEAARSERAHPEGAVKASSHIRFEMVMTLRHAGEATKLVAHVSTPGTKTYRHFYSTKRWKKRFSPSAKQAKKVSHWLRTHHFTGVKASTDRLTVAATGTAKQVESAFGTSVAHYRVQGHRVRLASREPVVPSRLAAAVSGVLGINQTVARPGLARTPASAGSASSAKPADDVPPPPSFTTAGPCGVYYGQKTTTLSPEYGHGYAKTVPNVVCGYTPSQFRSGYRIPAADTGKGARVAITDAYASSTMAADATKFAQRNDPSHPFSDAAYTETLQTPFIDKDTCDASGWTGEEALDVEAVHAMAPKAHIHYYGAKSCIGSPLFDVVHQIVASHAADVITNSWDDAAGDLLDDNATKVAFDNVLKMAAATGISVTFSSGDDGDDFSLVGVSAPEYPAGSPYVTAVGGTTLAIGKGGKRVADYGWSTGRSFLCTANVVDIAPGCTSSTIGTWSDAAFGGAGGGYTSYAYDQPAYQKGVVPDALAQRNAPALGDDANKRVVPDISLDADPGTGMLVGQTQTYPDGSVKYGEYRIGGTSVSSPLLAGVIGDSVGVAGHGLGLINPTIYGFVKTKPGVLEDVLPTPGKVGMARFDYAYDAFGAGKGKTESFREVTYEGDTTYCDGTDNCATRPNTLSTAKGYDSLTGLGSINPGFVAALAK